MAFNVGSLEPRIYDILSAPGTDLATISAKRVRKQLLESDPSLSADFLKENKEEVDTIIARVFEKVSAESQTPSTPLYPVNGSGSGRGGQGVSSQSAKKEQSVDEYMTEEYGGYDEQDEEATPPPAKKKSKKGGKNGTEMSDAELARKLSSEINGRSTRTGNKARSGGNNSAKKRSKKSSATVDSDADSDNSGGKKKTRKRSVNSSGGAKGGFAKEFTLSDPLAALLQVDKLSRPQVVKQLWVYIKENELQNPGNKREILCDPSMRAVFGAEKVGMFKMNKVLSQHLHEIE